MSISRHTSYNLAGMALPLIVTVVTVPLYLEIVGVERYGALTICWILLGYLGFLDLGLGPAVSQKIAAARNDADDGAPRIFWTAFWISAVMGIVAAVLLYLGGAYYFTHVPATEADIAQEMIEAVPVLALIAPVVMTSSVMSGALQGREKFLAINAVTMLGTTLMSTVPLLLAYLFGPSLWLLILGALASRFLSVILSAIICARVLPLTGVRLPERALIRPLITFGGWVTLSVAAAPLLLTLDRLAIGALLGAAAVAIYSIPYNVIGRLGMLASSLSSALFPRFAYADGEERARLMASAIPAVAVVITPVVVFTIAAIEPLLRLWIGAEMAAASAPVAYIFAAGIWANSFGHLSYALLQASGRPDIVSKLLLAELVPYWILLFAGLWFFGLPGAALAWMIRMWADSLLLSYLAGTFRHARHLIIPALLVLATTVVAFSLEGIDRYVALGGLLLLVAAWSFMNVPDVLRTRLGRFAQWLPKPRQGVGGAA